MTPTGTCIPMACGRWVGTAQTSCRSYTWAIRPPALPTARTERASRRVRHYALCGRGHRNRPYDAGIGNLYPLSASRHQDRHDGRGRDIQIIPPPGSPVISQAGDRCRRQRSRAEQLCSLWRTDQPGNADDEGYTGERLDVETGLM